MKKGTQSSNSTEENEGEKDQEIKALRREYNELMTILDYQINESSKRGKRNRRMIHLTLLIASIIASSFVYGDATTFSDTLVHQPVCSLSLHYFCLNTFDLGLSVIAFFFVSMILFVIGSTGGLPIGVTGIDAEIFEAEREFLIDRIGQLSELCEENLSHQEATFYEERIAGLFLILGLGLLIVLMFSLVTERPVRVESLGKFTIFIGFTVILVEWHSPDPMPSIAYLQRLYERLMEGE